MKLFTFIKTKDLFFFMVLHHNWFWKCWSQVKSLFVISNVCNLYNSGIVDMPCSNKNWRASFQKNLPIIADCTNYFHQVVNRSTMLILASGSYMLIHVCSESTSLDWISIFVVSIKWDWIWDWNMCLLWMGIHYKCIFVYLKYL